MKTRPHIVVVDDDETELTTFRRLYEGDRFHVTTVCAQFPRSALPAIEQAIGHNGPDLFVLDLSFPVTSAQPTGFTGDTSSEARAHLARVMRATQELEAMFIDDELLERSGKELLRAGSDLVFGPRRCCATGATYWTVAVGRHRSDESASRKATVEDVRLALTAGALDVLIKPHRSLEASEAVHLRDSLARYCEGTAPYWRGHLG